jgi:hypothetical protein
MTPELIPYDTVFIGGPVWCGTYLLLMSNRSFFFRRQGCRLTYQLSSILAVRKDGPSAKLYIFGTNYSAAADPAPKIWFATIRLLAGYAMLLCLKLKTKERVKLRKFSVC